MNTSDTLFSSFYNTFTALALVFLLFRLGYEFSARRWSTVSRSGLEALAGGLFAYLIFPVALDWAKTGFAVEINFRAHIIVIVPALFIGLYFGLRRVSPDVTAGASRSGKSHVNH